MMRTLPCFKIGITFSGAYRRNYVEPICNALLHMGYRESDIFYDEWHDDIINGPHGDDVLRQIYYKQCQMVVVLLSPDYKRKPWCGNVEWNAVKELINTGDGDKICLLRVDSANIGEIEGLYQTQSIAKDIDYMSPENIAKFIDRRYRRTFSGGLALNNQSSNDQKPYLIRKSSGGVSVKDEWRDYIIKLIRKISYFTEWFGEVTAQREDGETWFVVFCCRDGLMLKAQFTADTEKSKLQVWENTEKAYKGEAICDFSLYADGSRQIIEEYRPGDWDEIIFSWKEDAEQIPVARD